MAEGLPKRRQIRAGHRASATRMMRQVEDLTAVEDGVNTMKLSWLKLSLQEKLDTLKLLDGEIIELVGESEVAIERADSFKEGIYTTMVSIDNKCVIQPANAQSSSSPVPDLDTSCDSLTRPQVKLPKLTICPFNGDITKWMTFWDSYESSIHNNDGLSDIDKFNYLRSWVECTAQEAINGLNLTAANYHEAIVVLKKRFGNKQKIISKHMDILLNLEPIVSHHNLRGLITCMTL